jgi:hypothetical protein
MYRIGLGVTADWKEAYAWSEVARLEGNTFAERERDTSLRHCSRPRHPQGHQARDRQRFAYARLSQPRLTGSCAPLS